ncbi:hypothetical protein PUNSTDRAFT_44946 [Punctularia strigosozonata HHB-11173 SS5]|uniref:uncharacterized protein n=1 Tax=Punctularia strigosozonata (strain HHB-11173) TaxID=741275 RepID=UPI000441844B|nr:uncharacterized protein PUNSTDRAFT_44946 [Punctularia strigosozonata HHB-11173 SS5]EIN08446.1 hypothetical protein PUNSTDRAFT_44946 [Punctularia strigosozonata HHB-11173 SS5]
MDSKLHVDVPGYGVYSFSRDPACRCAIQLESLGSLDSLEIITEHDNDMVCRATWTGQSTSNESSSLPSSVVLKLVFCEPNSAFDIELEAEMYAHASGIQGTVIPRCFGLFSGSAVDDDDDTAKLLLLEDCGDPMRDPDGSITNADGFYLPDSKKIISQILLLHHDGGILHGNLEAKNIVWKNGKPVIVDLSQASFHKCLQKMSVTPLTLAPKFTEFGCGEIHTACIKYGVWFRARMPKMFWNPLDVMDIA